jgi:hypothetical protein
MASLSSSNPSDGSNCTIVSAFLTNVNGRKELNIDNYIENGRRLMQQNVQKTIFMESDIFEKYYKDDIFPSTHIILFEKKDIYLYDYLSKITKFELNSTHPEKDTIEFLFVQCHKTEWVKQAIEVNYFGTDQFIWVDFGIYHVINNENDFTEQMETIVTKTSDRVSIASCWNPNQWYWKNIYKDIAWFFAGGVFGGDKTALCTFADYTRKKCIEIIETRNHIMWEVNIWYLIYQDHPTLFRHYPADHDKSIFENYV